MYLTCLNVWIYQNVLQKCNAFYICHFKHNMSLIFPSNTVYCVFVLNWLCCFSFAVLLNVSEMWLATNLLAIDVNTAEKRLKFNTHFPPYIHLVRLTISVIVISETNHLSLNGRCRSQLMDANLLTLMSWSKSSVKAMRVSVQPAAKCSIWMDIQQSYFHLSVMTTLMSIYFSWRTNTFLLRDINRELPSCCLLQHWHKRDINVFRSFPTFTLNAVQMGFTLPHCLPLLKHSCSILL